MRWISTSTVRRILWASMGVVHAPALLSAWHAVLTGSDPSRLDTCLWLTVWMVFFALKAWDVEVLRFSTSRRSLAAIIVAVGLLHAEAVGGRLNAPALPPEVPVVATALIASGLHAVQRVGEVGPSIPYRKTGPLPQTRDVALATVFAAHGWIFTSRSRTPRAPPA